MPRGVLEEVGEFKLIDYLVGVGSDDVFVVDFEGIGWLPRVARESQYAHARDVVGRKHTEVLRLVVLLHLPVVHPGHCLHEVDHSAPVVGGRLIHKGIADEGPDPFILMHMRPDVHIHQSLPIDLPRQLLEQVRHRLHGVSAVRVHLRAHHWVVGGHYEELVGMLVSGFVGLADDLGFHGLVLLVGAVLVDLIEGVEEEEGCAIEEAEGLGTLEVALADGDVAEAEALIEEIVAFGQSGLVVSEVDDHGPEAGDPADLIEEEHVAVAVGGL